MSRSASDQSLAGWGNYPRITTRLRRARGAAEMQAAIAAHANLIGRGNGRAYGDSALNPELVLSLLPSDRILDFDPVAGWLECESGLLLADIIDLFLPRGWFPPVTPGSKFVSVGGMIAADVHGKNHHGAGSFGAHVSHMMVALADGRVLRCSAGENADLFAATIGGMGLTGIIISARFRLMRVESAYIRQDTRRAGSLDEAMALLEQSGQARYSVGWIDCLAGGAAMGRSLIYFGDHARPDQLTPEQRVAPLQAPSRRKKRIPIDLPSVTLNRWSVRAFNEIYYRAAREGQEICDYDSYFYPLDAILEWNRIYGRPGFVQYQCVLPKSSSREGLRSLLRAIAASGQGSFLAVLKLFGPQSGLLSFPMEGFTLALDFCANPTSLALLAELDRITLAHAGRLYLAKDACSGPEMLRFYPGLEEFRAIRRKYDPNGKFQSLQSQRLGL